MKFKIGDKVVGIAPCDNDVRYIGIQGKVSYVDTRGTRIPYEVTWEIQTKNGDHKWYCEESSLSFVKVKKYIKRKKIIPESLPDDRTPVGSRRPWSTKDKYLSNESGNIIQSKRPFGVEIECIAPSSTAMCTVGNAFPELGIGSDGGGYEFKTPRLSGIKGEQYIVNLGHKLLEKDFNVKPTCGLHIHLDGGDDFIESKNTKQDSAKTKRLKVLLRFLATYESVIQSFLPASRRNSNWCPPLHFSDSEIRKCKTQFDIEKLWYEYQIEYQAHQTPEDTVAAAKRSTRGGSRSGFNFSPFFAENHIEIRYHSGTISSRKILEWVNLFTTILDLAAEDSLHITDISRMPSVEERTKVFFDDLQMDDSSQEYFLARQALFKYKVELAFDAKAMDAIIKVDNEVLI